MMEINKMDIDNPEDREEMRKELMYTAYAYPCICETLRTIYDVIHELPDKKLQDNIVEKLIDAMFMSKKMSEKLTYYHLKYVGPIPDKDPNDRIRGSYRTLLRRRGRDTGERPQ